MSTPRFRIQNKRLIYSVILTVSLLLVLLGIRVPHHLGAHSHKPKPRAVIESTVKDSQDEGSRRNLAYATCHISVILDIPTQYIIFSRQEFQKISSIPLDLFNARAPPIFIA